MEYRNSMSAGAQVGCRPQRLLCHPRFGPHSAQRGSLSFPLPGFPAARPLKSSTTTLTIAYYRFGICERFFLRAARSSDRGSSRPCRCSDRCLARLDGPRLPPLIPEKDLGTADSTAIPTSEGMTGWVAAGFRPSRRSSALPHGPSLHRQFHLLRG
jgi:hypothetical protein